MVIKILIGLVLFAVLLVGSIYMLGREAFGTPPGQEFETRFQSSPHYDKTKKIFINRIPNLIEEMRKKAMTVSGIIEFFRKGEGRSPAKKLPEVKPDLQEFLKPSTDLKVIWFGHSTFLMNFSGKIILVDPVFSGAAAPFSFMIKRFQPPVLKLEELPDIDYVVISHDHYDHLDMQSIKFFKDKKAKFLMPLGVSSHVTGWGVAKDRITELDWWETHQADGIQFTATPAQHFSGRDGRHDNTTLWASWVVKNDKHNVYFSGDSGYDTHFKDIGAKYGPFDIAFVETGQYNEKWKQVHMLPDESVQAYFDLKAKRFFPVHWGMFTLAFHTWYDPIVKLEAASKEKGVNIVTPRLGEIVTVNDSYQYQNWWSSLLP